MKRDRARCSGCKKEVQVRRYDGLVMAHRDTRPTAQPVGYPRSRPWCPGSHRPPLPKEAPNGEGN